MLFRIWSTSSTAWPAVYGPGTEHWWQEGYVRSVSSLVSSSVQMQVISRHTFTNSVPCFVYKIYQIFFLRYYEKDNCDDVWYIQCMLYIFDCLLTWEPMLYIYISKQYIYIYTLAQDFVLTWANVYIYIYYLYYIYIIYIYINIYIYKH